MATGLMLLPGALMNAALSPIMGRLFDQIGGRILTVVGLVITAGSTLAFSFLTTETSYAYLLTMHSVRMVGFSMIMMPVQTNGLNQLPARFYPHGTAMNNTFNQVSGAIGTALLVTLMSHREKTHAVQLTEEAINHGNGQPTVEVMNQIGMAAMVEGVNFAFFISTILLIMALVLACFMKRGTPEEDSEEEEKKIAKASNDTDCVQK